MKTDGFGFRVVGDRRFVEVVGAWVGHAWPMLVEEAVALCVGFGWEQSPQKADSFLVVEGDLVGEVSLRLSNWVPEEDWERSLPKSRAAFDEYVRAYTEVLGESFSFEDEGTDFSRRWILDTKVMVMLIGNEAFISLYIDSPENTGIFLWEREMEERGEPLD